MDLFLDEHFEFGLVERFVRAVGADDCGQQAGRAAELGAVEEPLDVAAAHADHRLGQAYRFVVGEVGGEDGLVFERLDLLPEAPARGRVRSAAARGRAVAITTFR